MIKYMKKKQHRTYRENKLMKHKRISSESSIILILIKELLMLPVEIIKFFFGKSKKNPFSKIVNLLKEYINETKFTTTIIFANIITYIASGFFSEELFILLANSPVNMLSGRLYSLITSGFLHANITHLLGNCLFIFIFGRVVERELGTVKTGLTYFGAMIIAAFFSNLIYILFLNQNILGVGASGALMGLVSTAMLLDPFYLTYIYIIPVPIVFVGWMAIYGDIIGILNPSGSNIGHFAHIGGFISIGLLMYFFNRKERERMRKGIYINIISVILALIILSIII